MINNTMRCLLLGTFCAYGAATNSVTNHINSKRDLFRQKLKNDPLHNNDVIYWEEEYSSPFVNDDKLNDEEKKIDETKKRSLISFSRESELQEPCQKRYQNNQVLPHPLRTDEWDFILNWRYRKQRRTKWHIEFHTNGFARVKETSLSNNSSVDDKNSFFAIGLWELLPNGRLIVALPYNNDNRKSIKQSSSQVIIKDNDNEMTQPQCNNDDQIILMADLHHNPFGLQPKLSRGIILHIPSKRSWLRPIIATFSANGAGTDTADFSYQSRH